MTRAEERFQDALLRCDSGDVARGEASLREALALADAGGEGGLAARVCCVLANLLLLDGRRDEAVALLRRVLTTDPADATLAFEQRTARELLAELGL